MFNTFSTAQDNTPIRTPAEGKSIFLTAVQTSTLADITITLSRAGNDSFMSIVLTTTFATYGESFASPVRFVADEAISLTTNAAGTMNITLIGYEA